jgi:hypothetical protein
LFREFIAGWMGEAVSPDRGEPAPLRAELMAAAVVAAHNHVLRRWLRGESPDPVREVDAALREVIGLFALPGDGGGGIAGGGDAGGGDGGTTIVAFRTRRDISAVLPELRRLVADADG